MYDIVGFNLDDIVCLVFLVLGKDVDFEDIFEFKCV